MNRSCDDPYRHPAHSWGETGWCDGDGTSDGNLLADLDQALIANGTVKRCVACEVVAGVSEEARGPLASAMAGTIGRDKLVAILARNGYNVGRRALERHRQEGHTP